MIDEKIKYELERYRGRVYRDVMGAEDQALIAIKKIFLVEIIARLPSEVNEWNNSYAEGRNNYRKETIRLLEEMKETNES